MIRTFLQFTVFFLIASVGNAMADTGDAVNAAARMKERLPQVNSMKAAGEVGEAMTGYLEPREDLGPRKQSLVDAENADRKIVYTVSAANTGQSVEEVGRQRAAKIASQSVPGIWLQKSDGTWYRKE